MSLKIMIKTWLYKGQITQEEYDAIISKLNGHNKQLRKDVINECIKALGDNICTTAILERLKGD